MSKDLILREVGEKAYQRSKDELGRGHLGKMAAMCDAGVAGVGDDVDEVLDGALERHPGKVFYVRRIGSCPAFHMF